MASKNLGAVIQRAISDGAFRRQLQSDPAAALRGFNLSPDEIAAVRSGDSSKLMSLGVDQRMSKAFGISGAATKNAMTGDITASTSNSIAGTDGGSIREGIPGDPTSGARAANSDGQVDGQTNVRSAFVDGDSTTGARDAHASGAESGARATLTAPQDSYRAINDPENTGATRETINDATVAGTRSASSSGTQDSYRPINDPDNTGATRETVSSGTQDSYRAINDPDNTGATRETVSGQLQDSPRAINDPDRESVSSHMADANSDLPGSDVQHDPGFVDTHSAFNPSDSADVQRELLDSTHGSGDAIGNTGHTGVDS